MGATEPVRRLTATLGRLRVDRQLDEAVTHGPDPLHLAAVFGLDDKTAIRYANAARQIPGDLRQNDMPSTWTPRKLRDRVNVRTRGDAGGAVSRLG